MKTHNYIPTLRFKEFNAEFSPRVFDEIADITRLAGYEYSEYWKEDDKKEIIALRGYNIGKGKLELFNLAYISNELSMQLKRSRLYKGDIVYPCVGSIGNAAVIEEDDKFHIQQNIAKIKCKDGISPYFLVQFLTSDFGTNQVYRFNASGAQPNVLVGSLRRYKINLPSFSEQKKIASFLSAVDEKIQQLTLKKELLGQYKKGVMQQLFSGKVRFKDEDGGNYPKWKKMQLGDVGDFQTSSVNKLSVPGEKEVYLVNYMNVYRHEKLNKEKIEKLQVVTAKLAQINSSNLKRGDILFTPSSETPTDIGHSVVIFEDLEDCVYSYHLMRFRPKIDLDILYSHYFCNIPDVLGQLSKLSTGSTRFTISVKSFSSVKIELPCLEEQGKIAKYLSVIDAKIDGVVSQITQTQIFKKGLLQQMFV